MDLQNLNMMALCPVSLKTPNMGNTGLVVCVFGGLS